MPGGNAWIARAGDVDSPPSERGRAMNLAPAVLRLRVVPETKEERASHPLHIVFLRNPSIPSAEAAF